MQNQFQSNMVKMRVGTGAGQLLYGNEKNSHHYIDSLQRFQKDFATSEKQRREQQRLKKQAEIERKRLEYLERESKRWENVQSNLQKEKQSRQFSIKMQVEGLKRTANVNGLPYNPISLQYENSAKGQNLKTRDEDYKIRGLVRAHNMDSKGNSKYNPLTGESRMGIERLVPPELTDRFGNKLQQHYEAYKLKVPGSSGSTTKKY